MGNHEQADDPGGGRRPGGVAGDHPRPAGRYGADYRVVAATSGDEALAVLARAGPAGPAGRAGRLRPADAGDDRHRGARARSVGTPRTPSCCCSRRTPTPTWRSRRSTTSASTTTCSSRGTRRRSGCTRSSTTCSTTGRQGHPDDTGEVRVVGHRWSERSHEMKTFLARNHVPYRWLDVERDEGAAAAARARRRAAPTTCPWCWSRTVPTLRAPTTLELADALGLRTTARAAALRPVHRRWRAGRDWPRRSTARRRGCARSWSSATRPAARPARAPRSRTTSGFPKGLSGADLTHRAVAQARAVRRRDGARPRRRRLRAAVVRCAPCASTDGGEIEARAVLVATGVSYRRLEPRRARARSPARGVYYGATASEARAVRGRRGVRRRARRTRPGRRRSTSRATPSGW